MVGPRESVRWLAWSVSSTCFMFCNPKSTFCSTRA
jgi:hypothetical protein